MSCCSKDKNLNSCNNDLFNNTKYCEKHQYMQEYTNEMLNKLKICSRCKNCHYSENNKTCQKCRDNNNAKKNEIKQKKILCIVKDCVSEKNNDNNYCKNHQYMKDYTEDMLNNLTNCSGCKRLHYLKNMKTCDNCRNRSSKIKFFKDNIVDNNDNNNIVGNNIVDNNIVDNNIVGNNIVDNNIVGNNIVDNNIVDNNIVDNNIVGNNSGDNNVFNNNYNNTKNKKILCVYNNCKIKKSDENEYCKLHQRQKFLQDTLKIGKKVCVNNIRGCRVHLDMDYEKSICEECLKIDRENDKKNRNNVSGEIINGEKICSVCCKNYSEDYFIGNRGNITKTCKKCREDNKKQDEKRDKEHVNEIARVNSKKPERIEVKKEWKEKHPEKSASYWIKARGKKILCDYEKYLKDNSEYAKKWRDENPEKVLENNENKKNSIVASWKTYRRSAIDKNLSFEFTLEEFKELTTKNCYYCGELQEKGFNGIDRKKCTDNYVKDCCVSCCSTCNYIKGSLDDIVFLKRIEHILTFQEYIKGDLFPELFGNHITVNYNKYKKRAEDILIKEFNLTSMEFLEIISNNCYICGKEPNDEHLNGIDRIDNDKGYTLDNVSSCCGECNYMKKNYDLEEFFNKMKKIYNNKLSDIENDDNIIDIGNKNNYIIEYTHVNKKTKESKKEEGLIRKQFKKDIIIEQYSNENNIKERIGEIVENRKNKN